MHLCEIIFISAMLLFYSVLMIFLISSIINHYVKEYLRRKKYLNYLRGD